MPDVTPEAIHAYRNRWRAQLLRLHADELDASTDGATPVVAAELTVTAAQKRDEADLYDELASDLEEYEAKRAGLADGSVPREEWRAFSAAFAAKRGALRMFGAINGTRGSPAVNDFTEPTDDEITEVLA